jgi:sorbitol-specific phosphotransferase system component IIC
MKLEVKMRLRYAIATILWIVVFCVGVDKAFLRYICANPVPYDPVTNHPYTCRPPYTTFGSIVIFLGIIVGATALAALYWKFGLPRGSVQKTSNEERTESKV